jgi:hypothetical protein
MYKFLGIQSRKDASDEYQPKGDYLTPSDYENMYGNAIDLKFKGYLPIGDYVKQGEFNTFKDTLKTGLQSSLKEQEDGFLRITNNLQPKGDYVTLSQFNSYTKDADTKFNNLIRFAGTTEEFIREFNQLKNGLKPTFEEIEGRARRDYLTKEEFEAFKVKTLSQFNSYTKDADTKFNNLIRFAGTTEEFIREFNQLKNGLKPTFEEIEGRARRDYLTKEEFEAFKVKLMQNVPSINAAFTPVTKLSPRSYLRHKNYMHY